MSDISDMGEPSVFPMEPESGTSGRQYRLALRGNSLNPMIDAATPLLGMVMRLSTMNSQAMPEHLFAQVVTDVQAVEQLLQEQGYEPGVIVCSATFSARLLTKRRWATAGPTKTNG